MKKICFLFFLLTIYSRADFALLGTEDVDDYTIQTVLNEEDLLRTKPWSGDGVVPYDIGKILNAAKIYYLHKNPGARDVRVRSFHFDPAHYTEEERRNIPDRWVFCVVIEEDKYTYNVVYLTADGVVATYRKVPQHHKKPKL